MRESGERKVTLTDVEEASKQDREVGFWRRKSVGEVCQLCVCVCKTEKGGGGDALKYYAAEISYFLNFSFLFEEQYDNCGQ